MTHVILGLLLIAPQSMYDIVKAFAAGVRLFYSPSSGSIKRALDTLLTEGRIEVMSVETGGRGKKTYRATEAGREEFHRWMTGELTGTDLEAAVLPRLFFLGLLDPAERGPMVTRMRERAEAELAELRAQHGRIDAKVDPQALSEEHRGVLTYQRATLDFGISSAVHAVSWLEDLEQRGADQER